MKQDDTEIATRGCDGVSSAACFLIGLGIGSAAALLFAPVPGKKLRFLVGKRVVESKHMVQKQVEHTLDKATEVANQAQALIDASKKYLNDESRRVDAAIKAGKEAYLSSGSQGPAV